jgi:CheY-like chemotaxis protein
MDGCEVARRIRAHPRFRQLLLVAQTGWGNEECRRLTTEAGFDHHLVKPVDLTLLVNLLARSTPGEGARSA